MEFDKARALEALLLEFEIVRVLNFLASSDLFPPLGWYPSQIVIPLFMQIGEEPLVCDWKAVLDI